MARRSVQWRREFSFPGDPPTPAARGSVADDRRALPPRRPPVAENRLAPRAGEEDFRWLQASRPGSPESGSGTPSPQLWAQHPHYDRLYPASAGGSPSRAQAIAGYRREMLDLVRGLPEAAYELSLRDIVESRGPSPLPPPPPPPPTQPFAASMQGQEGDEPKKHVATAAMLMDDEQAKKQSGGKKQRNQRTMGRTRSRSIERSVSVSLDTGLLIKLFMPLSVGRKKKVSPKPAAPAGTAKESRKKKKQGKKKEDEEEWWKKSEFSEAGSSSRTSSTGSSNSNGSASRNGNGHVNGGSNPQAPARSRSSKDLHKDENCTQVPLQSKATDTEQHVPAARRRRTFTHALEKKMSPGGREVAGPRTPESLHPALPVTSLPCFNISRFKISIWSRRIELQLGEKRTRRPPGTASTRKGVLHHGAAPSSIAGEDEHHQQNPTPTRLQLQDAAGKDPYSSYAIYSWDTRFPHPPAAGAAGGGGGNRRITGGEVDLRGR